MPGSKRWEGLPSPVLVRVHSLTLFPSPTTSPSRSSNSRAARALLGKFNNDDPAKPNTQQFRGFFEDLEVQNQSASNDAVPISTSTISTTDESSHHASPLLSNEPRFMLGLAEHEEEDWSMTSLWRSSGNSLVLVSVFFSGSSYRDYMAVLAPLLNMQIGWWGQLGYLDIVDEMRRTPSAGRSISQAYALCHLRSG